MCWCLCAMLLFSCEMSKCEISPETCICAKKEAIADFPTCHVSHSHSPPLKVALTLSLPLSLTLFLSKWLSLSQSDSHPPSLKVTLTLPLSE